MHMSINTNNRLSQEFGKLLAQLLGTFLNIVLARENLSIILATKNIPTMKENQE
jgi:hypothetical protein